MRTIFGAILGALLLIAGPVCAETGTTSSRLNDQSNLEFQVEGETSVMLSKPGAVCNSASEGAMYYDKTKHALVICNGTEWKSPGGVSLDDMKWFDMTASRAAGVTYTNTTGHAIIVSISLTDGSITGGNVYVNETLIFAFSQMTRGESNSTIIVPAGATYRLRIGFGSLYKWLEFRAS